MQLWKDSIGIKCFFRLLCSRNHKMKTKNRDTHWKDLWMWGKTLSSLQLNLVAQSSYGSPFGKVPHRNVCDSFKEAWLHMCPQTSPSGISLTGPCFILPQAPRLELLGDSLCSFHFGILGRGRAGRNGPFSTFYVPMHCRGPVACTSLYLGHQSLSWKQVLFASGKLSSKNTPGQAAVLFFCTLHLEYN